MQVSFNGLNSRVGKFVVICIIAVLLFLFLSRKDVVHKPKVVGICLPGSKVDIDQHSVTVQDRPIEVGADVLLGRYDNKDLYGVRVFLKWRF